MPSSRARLVLCVIGGKHEGMKIAVERNKPLRIGRSADCHLRPNSDQVSRDHCEIFYSLAGFMVKDNGSRSGTFVDNARIDGPTLLSDGRTLRVGPFTFRVSVMGGADEAAAAGDSSLREADICEWLDEPATAAVQGREPKPHDDIAELREVLRVSEQSCAAAEDALSHIRRRK